MRWYPRSGPWIRASVLAGLALAGLALAAGPVEAGLVINEVLPDPEGSDGGREFVEILNAGLESIDIHNVELQFANGAEGPVWRSRWRCEVPWTLSPGARFLLVDRNWLGAATPDAEAALGLQNGPDAVRLVRGETVLDLVGYGPLTDPALREGSPAGVETGRSLARRPDGRDTHDNGADFVLAAPTPGEINFRPWSLAVESITYEPPSLVRARDPVEVRVRMRNDGLETWPSAGLAVTVGGDSAGVFLPAWPADETREVAWILRPGREGTWPVVLAGHPAGAPAPISAELGRLQIGPGAIVLNEVLAAPAHEQGEWFELRVVGPGAVDLADYEVRDEGGAWRRLPAVRLTPGDLCVVAQDSAALQAWIATVTAGGGRPQCPAEPAPGTVVSLGSWPTLNNSAGGGDAFADRLHLRDRDGTTVDHVVLGAAGGPDVAGRSLERSAIAARHPVGTPWAVCTAAAGSTPACANSAASPAVAGAGLVLAPSVLDAAAGNSAVHALFALPDGVERWSLRVFDLWGVAVRDFGGDGLGPGPRDLLWDGRDDGGVPVPAGGYVFALEFWSADDRPAARDRRLCAVRR